MRSVAGTFRNEGREGRTTVARTTWEEQLAKEIGRRVKELRASAHLSQEALARAMDMSRQTVFEIERGARLAEWDTYGRLADALGVEISAVLPLESVPARYLTRSILPLRSNTPPPKLSRQNPRTAFVAA
jgi:transcriptional regulator with XRE-family HTH domain